MANRTITIFINGKEVENSIKSIKNEYIKLYNEVAKMTPAQAGYNEKVAELKRTKGIIDEHRSTLSGAGKSWDTLKNGAAMVTPYIAGAFAAMKVGQAIMESANDASDKLGEHLAGLESGYEAVKRAFANGLDLSTFFSDISKAVSVGKELYRMRDELEDKTRSLTVVESKYNNEIIKQRYIAADQMKTDEERRTALKKAISLEKELDIYRKSSSQLNFDISEKDLVFQSKLAQVSADATEEQRKEAEDNAKLKLKNFVEEYEQNGKLRNQAVKYNEAIDNLAKSQEELKNAQKGDAKMGMGNNTAIIQDNIQFFEKSIAGASENVKTYAAILKGYGAASNKAIDGYIAASKKQYDTDAQFFENTIKMEKQLTGFEKSIQDEKNKTAADEKKKEEEWLKAEEALNQKIRKLQNDFDTYNLSAKEKEVLQTKQKYAALYEEAKGHTRAITQLKSLEGQELSAIDIKYANDAIKESQKLADKLLKVNEDRFKNVVKSNEEESDAVRSIQLALTEEGERKKQEEIFAIEDKYAKLIELAKKYGFDTTALTQQMNADIAAVGSQNIHPFGMNDEQWERFQNDFNSIRELSGMALSAWQGLSDIQSAEEEQHLQRLEEANNQEKDTLDRMLENKLISQEAYNRRTTNLDKDLENKKKAIDASRAAREKKIKTFETIINTAAAIVGFLANPGGPWGAALSIAAGITGVIQLAAINKAQPFAKGGRIKKETFARMGEAGEEGVISNKTLIDPTTGPLSNWLLDKQDGLNPSFPTTMSPAVPYSDSSFSSQSNSTPVINVTAPASDNGEVLNELKILNKFLSDPKNRQAYISSDIQKKYNDENNLMNGLKKLG